MEAIIAIHGCAPRVSFSLMGDSFLRYGGGPFFHLELCCKPIELPLKKKAPVKKANSKCNECDFQFEIYAYIRLPNCTCIGYTLHESLLKFILGILNMLFTETPALAFAYREFLGFGPL